MVAQYCVLAGKIWASSGPSLIPTRSCSSKPVHLQRLVRKLKLHVREMVFPISNTKALIRLRGCYMRVKSQSGGRVVEGLYVGLDHFI